MIDLFRNALDHLWDGHDCPVCGRFAPGEANQPRTRIVVKILELAKRQGGFAVKSLDQFWLQFREELCLVCRNNFDGRAEKLLQTKKLLEEAIRLDSGNTQARENQAVVKKMT
jgi:hypothetical protein